MKKRILLLLANFFALNITAEIPHGKEHDFMLVASPSSGSSFLAQALKESLSDLKYSNETFQHLFRYNDSNIPELSQLAHKLPQYYLENFYLKKWINLPFSLTKDVFLHFLIPFFQEKFTIVGLYRHRKYTFPTTPGKEKLFFLMYESFLTASYEENTNVYKIQFFLKTKPQCIIQKRCAAHIIYNYVLLQYCAKYSIPIINYTKIISFNITDLTKYLENKIPSRFYSPILPQIIDENRIQKPNFLENRVEKYQQLEVEPFCQELIAFIKNLDPDMPYWHLLE